MGYLFSTYGGAEDFHSQILGRTFVVQTLSFIGDNTFSLGQQLKIVIHLYGANQ